MDDIKSVGPDEEKVKSKVAPPQQGVDGERVERNPVRREKPGHLHEDTNLERAGTSDAVRDYREYSETVAEYSETVTEYSETVTEYSETVTRRE